jgi:hypothetical protein
MLLGNSGDTDPGIILDMDPVFLLVIQAFSTIFLFFGASLLIIYWPLRLTLKPFFPSVSLKDIGLTVLLVLSFLVVNSAIGEWNLNLDFPDGSFEDWARTSEESLKTLTEHLTNFQSSTHFVLGFVVIAIIPAVTEELLFRGLIQNFLYKATHNPHIAIWFTGFIFSAIHLQFYGFFPRAFLGVLFGYLYYWSGNLTIPMIAHFLNNGIGVVVYYLAQNGTLDISPEQMEKAAPWPALVIFSFAFIYFLNHFYRTYQKEHG